MENIDDIKILQVNGSGGFSGAYQRLRRHVGRSNHNASLADQMVQQRTALPQ